MKEALKNYKVLDLSRTIGRFCTMFLADMGADVIKIQEIDPAMKRGIKTSSPEQTAAFESTDRNKKSICLDLKSEMGQKIFYKLTKTADIVVEDFRPGVTKRLKIDYEILKKYQPSIIYCAITGYGQDGPYRLYPGHDPNYESISGLLGITCTSDGTFCLPGAPIADFGGGSMSATIGILLAIIARAEYGVGQFVDISMLDGAISIMAWRYGATYLATGLQPKPGERPSHVYRTKDGKYINICCPEPWFWERLCRVLGLEKYIPYSEEIMALHAYGHYDKFEQSLRKEVISKLKNIFLTKNRDEWLKLLYDADTCVAPVYSFEEVFSDPHVVSRNMIIELDHPKLGRVRQVGIPIKLSQTPGRIKSFAPVQGENTEEILKGIGFTRKEILSLSKQGVVKIND